MHRNPAVREVKPKMRRVQYPDIARRQRRVASLPNSSKSDSRQYHNAEVGGVYPRVPGAGREGTVNRANFGGHLNIGCAPLAPRADVCAGEEWIEWNHNHNAAAALTSGLSNLRVNRANELVIAVVEQQAAQYPIPGTGTGTGTERRAARVISIIHFENRCSSAAALSRSSTTAPAGEEWNGIKYSGNGGSTVDVGREGYRRRAR
ncbi:hypothetical protein B0H16DRAFT_1451593 [Mycena metata]|uniref:Uncharacterized protein n=1 Tax=Mycena metata TaxID=1033252 RepID=A0AAD7JVM9_9AGAR|nr:hypothetical protein B0H16DRAFT_1451593 [Mycena metata]